MLETLEKVTVNQDVLRFANLSHISTLAKNKGLTMDEITDVIAFERGDVAKELMDGPFERKAQLGSKFGLPSRFSDGEWPVFYAAVNRDTAEKECSYHYGRKAAGNPSANRSVYYSVVRCTFDGAVIDLQPKLTDWRDLVSDDYLFCTALGKEAHDTGLGGFLAPSARHSGGTTVPTFLAGSISNPIIISTARLSFNTGSMIVEFKDLPTV
ncbi:MAG: RES family NAD+ phosphorylase [Alphaproteobacteria bacterium]|nr:RES family NAD+ phosphorylase [Alphaproteobacteria bacterium]